MGYLYNGMDVYQENGYKNRKDYLMQIGDDYGADPQTVFELANVLGPNEDFDGLVSALEDYEELRCQESAQGISMM